MPYTPSGPFGNGSSSPPINAAFLNAVETALGVLANNIVMPQQFGTSVGTGGDDTAAFQAALNTGKNVYVPAGVYSCSDLVNTTGSSLTGAGKGQTKINARTGTGTLYKAQNMAELTISDLWLNGASNCNIVISTDWTTSNGPSLNSHYRNLRVTGGVQKTWSAQSNNDCEFMGILFEPASSGTVVLDLEAPGGAVELVSCKLFGPMILSAQRASFFGGVYTGVRLVGLDYNAITAIGGYWYGDPTYGCSIYIGDSSQIYAPASWFGSHFENQYASGSIINGGGKMFGVSTFIDPLMLQTGTAGTRTVIGGSVVQAGPVNSGVNIRGGFLQGFSPTSASANIVVLTWNTNVNGTYSNTGG